MLSAHVEYTQTISVQQIFSIPQYAYVCHQSQALHSYQPISSLVNVMYILLIQSSVKDISNATIVAIDGEYFANIQNIKIQASFGLHITFARQSCFSHKYPRFK